MDQEQLHIYDKTVLVLESQHTSVKNASLGTFTIDITQGGHTSLKDVVGLKFYSLEIIAPDGGSSSAVSNGSMYVILNDYKNVVTGCPTMPVAFARVTNGSSVLSQVAHSPAGIPSLGGDPFTYIFDPVQGTLSKFTVTLMKSSGQPYNTGGNNVILTLIAFTKRNKISRA
jgi:hypothetical protein